MIGTIVIYVYIYIYVYISVLTRFVSWLNLILVLQKQPRSASSSSEVTGPADMKVLGYGTKVSFAVREYVGFGVKG